MFTIFDEQNRFLINKDLLRNRCCDCRLLPQRICPNLEYLICHRIPHSHLANDRFFGEEKTWDLRTGNWDFRYVKHSARGWPANAEAALDEGHIYAFVKVSETESEFQSQSESQSRSECGSVSICICSGAHLQCLIIIQVGVFNMNEMELELELEEQHSGATKKSRLVTLRKAQNRTAQNSTDTNADTNVDVSSQQHQYLNLYLYL